MDLNVLNSPNSVESSGSAKNILGELGSFVEGKINDIAKANLGKNEINPAQQTNAAEPTMTPQQIHAALSFVGGNCNTVA